MKATFPNLEAEKVRRGLTDDDLAQAVGLTRTAFTKKKNNKGFSLSEINALLSLFDSTFDYLFFMS